MKRWSAVARVAFGLMCLSISVLLAALTLGLVPDRDRAILDRRTAASEALAINLSLLAGAGRLDDMQLALTTIVQRDDDLLSAAVRRQDGGILVETNAHQINWSELENTVGSRIAVPVQAGNQPWGDVELCFRPLTEPGLMGALRHPIARLMAFIAVFSFLLYLLYLRMMFGKLDASTVVPDRVRTALDTLAEGLLVLDKSERIVLANSAFGELMGTQPKSLEGRRASDLPWAERGSGNGGSHFPWSVSLREGTLQAGRILGLKSKTDAGDKTFMVNTAPILNDDGVNRGVLASFDDVTMLKRKEVELHNMLDELRKSGDEIRRQNEELERLATRDPLTSCFNRRSLFERFESHWSSAKRYNQPLACVMVDIDHFKLINDNHGHAVGDQVLQKIAAVLRQATRDCDVVARYGGEEFCVLLPQIDLEDGAKAAERFRREIESTKFPKLSVTASLGVSAVRLGGVDPQDMLNQADKSLYQAKRTGRNRVVRFDELPANFEVDQSKVSRIKEPAEEAHKSIPFHAVTALVSALAYRDLETGEHSRRVADLCVATADGLMSMGDCYVLESAALLHDIGKVGVPDSILLKPESLTDAEWDVMHIHDRIGVEIIRASFASERLVEIVENHQVWFDGTSPAGRLSGEAIPLGARILNIADAFDSMVTDRVYRDHRSRKEAFAELRRCAGTQFDPKLVERFIEVVELLASQPKAAMPGISKEAALGIGLQMERLAAALDARDFESLRTLAGRLGATAAKLGVPTISQRAAELQQLCQPNAELHRIVEITNDLLRLCRSTQSVLVSTDAEKTA